MEWKDEWLEEGIPFEDPSEKEEYCNYYCLDCRYEEGVPAFIIDEFAMGDENLKPGERPELLCPKCSGTMVFKDNKSESSK